MLFFIMTLSDDEKVQKTLLDIYTKYNDNLISYARCVLGDQSDAEDVVQSVYLALSRNIDRLERMTEKERHSYVNVAIKNRCINFLKERGEIEKYELYGEVMDTLYEESFENKIIENETIERIISIIKLIPSDSRNLLTLRLVYGYSFKRIATIQEKPVSTVVYQFKRTLEKLRKKIYEEGIIIEED